MSSYYYRQDTGIFSKRMIIFAAIVVFHVLIIWAFIVGFTNSGRALIQTILQTSVIEQPKQTVLPPPPPQAKLNVQAPTTVVAPDVIINIPTPPPTIHVVKAPPKPAPIHVAPVPIVSAKVTFSPDPQDYYPESSRRNNEEGRVMVHLCVDVRGRVGTAEVQTSSGHPLLDAAGIQLAKQIRFKPATRAGKPVPQCTLLPVKFTLTGAQ